MSTANRLFGRRGHRVTADRRNADAIAAELKKHPPVTIIGRLFADRTIGVGVRLDTSIYLRQDEKEGGPYQPI